MQLLSEMMVAICSFHQLCVGGEHPRFYSCEYKQILLLLWWFFAALHAVFLNISSPASIFWLP